MIKTKILEEQTYLFYNSIITFCSTAQILCFIVVVCLFDCLLVSCKWSDGSQNETKAGEEPEAHFPSLDTRWIAGTEVESLWGKELRKQSFYRCCQRWQEMQRRDSKKKEIERQSEGTFRKVLIHVQAKKGGIRKQSQSLLLCILSHKMMCNSSEPQHHLGNAADDNGIIPLNEALALDFTVFYLLLVLV